MTQFFCRAAGSMGGEVWLAKFGRPGPAFQEESGAAGNKSYHLRST